MNENTRDAPAGAGAKHHTGTDERGARYDDTSEGNPLVSVEKVLARFREQTGSHYRASSLPRYESYFRRFAKDVHLETFSRTQLRGKRGHQLLKKWMNENVAPASWYSVETRLRAIWTWGLEIPWVEFAPVERPEIPRPDSESTPPDYKVLKWKRAMAGEDAYTRVEFKLHGHFGGRPSHLQRIRWEDVRNRDDEPCWSVSEEDVPFAIRADGTKRRFKRGAWWIAWLPADLVADITAWRRELGDDWDLKRPVLPYRNLRGETRPDQMQPEWLSQDRLDLWIKKWALPELRRISFRKFAKSKADASGMDLVAVAWMLGHEPPGLARNYDLPSLQDVAARQSRFLPQGALGTVVDTTVKLGERASEAEGELLAAWRSGRLGDIELISRLRAIQLRETPQEI